MASSTHRGREKPRPLGETDTVAAEELPESRQAESKALFKSLFHVFQFGTSTDTTTQLVGAAAAIGAGAALPLMTLVFGQLVNAFNNFKQAGSPMTPRDFQAQIDRTCLWFVYLFVGKFLLVYVHTTCFTVTAIRMGYKLRLEYLSSLLHQDISYYDSSSPGSAITRITTNANSIYSGTADKLGSAIQAIAMFFSAFIVAFVTQWKLTLVCASTIPASFVALGATAMVDAKIQSKTLSIYALCGGLAEEVLSSMRTVIAFDAGRKLSNKYDAHLERAQRISRKKGPVLGLQYGAQWFFMFCGYALTFWFGIKLYHSVEITNPGVIIIVLFSVMIATNSFMQLAPNIAAFASAAAAAADIFAILNRQPAIDSTDTSRMIPETASGDIELRDVSFRYPGRPTVPVLSDISFTICEKKTTALVGASGAGKSTIIGLIERWYDPEEGGIYFDGRDIKDIDLKWLRRQIGLVQQEPVLFQASIFDNVAQGLVGTENENSTYEDKLKLVRDACVKANAHNFVQKLPKGYETNVGAHGSLISTGQKQRIAIARSIIGNPTILLLDEATSALDPRSEELVQAALERAAQQRTTVLIAHRLSTVKRADNIVVFDKGRIIEQGSYKSLMAADGLFAKLVRSQSLDAKLEDEGTETGKGNMEKEETSVLERTLSISRSAIETPTTRSYSLPRCLAIIANEQKNHWKIFLLGVLACTAGAAAFPAQAILFSRIVSVFQVPANDIVARGDFWALMFFILAIGALLAWACVGFFMTTLGMVVSQFYRSQYFRAMLRQDVSYFDATSSETLTSRLSADPTNIQELFMGKLGPIILSFVSLIADIALALAVGWKLAFVAIFGALPPIFAAGYTRFVLDRKLMKDTTRLYEESARFAAEALVNIRTVSSFTLETKIIKDYAQRLSGPVRSGLRKAPLIMIFFALSESLDLLAMGLSFWYGGHLMATDEYSTQQFFTIFVAIVYGGQAAGFLFGFSSDFALAHSAITNITQIREIQAPINGSRGASVARPRDGDSAVELHDVDFSYPTRPDVPVLQKFSLKIMPGETVGLVGASGSGKTTVFSVLERFYDIQSGHVKVLGRSIQELDIVAHRRRLSLVPQEPPLYQVSIRENIMIGVADDVREEQLVQACKDADIYDFVTSLPEGFDTDCGSKGLAVSGGQRQRIAIARALIRNPDILLLDEATSALDTDSEQAVHEAIAKSPHRTTIVVAHRLSTVQKCDRIFVLDAGRVIESGTHHELLALRGKYYYMCQSQLLE